MEKITAREFLKKYRTADRKIQMLAAEIEKIESMADGGAVNIDGQPHSKGASDKVATAATTAADLRGKLEAWILEQEEIKRRIINVLSELDDPNQLQVLRLRYMTDEIAETWVNIAYVMDRSERQVQRIHGYALQEVQRIIDGMGAIK